MSQISNLDLSTYIAMKDGDQVSGAIWSAMLTKIQTATNAAISAINEGNIGGSSDDKFYVNGTETTPENGKVTLVPYGNASYPANGYRLSGKLNAQIVIGTGADTPTDDTYIELDGVDITTDASDATTGNAGILYMPATQSLKVTLVKNKVNTIVCSHVAAKADSQKGCLWSENNMVVQGNGYLAVVNKGGHGLKASEIKLIGNPHIYVDAIHDGIHGNGETDILGGIYYIKNANDAFGTRVADSTHSAGVINVFGGEIYAYGIAQNVLDSKASGNIYKQIGIHTDVAAANVFSGISVVDPKVKFGAAVQNTTDGGYSTEPTGSVKCYTSSDYSDTGTVVTPADGVYTLTTKYCKVSGYINGKIVAPTQSTDINVSANTYITGNIEYTNTGKKLGITVEKDGIVLIVGGNVASSSNCAVEVKSGSFCYIKGSLSGDELTFTDTKGFLMIDGDVTGKDIYIGTAATANANKKMWGALMVGGTVKAILNSKFSKGWIHVLKAGLLGVFSAKKLDAAGYADLNASTHAYYHEASGIVIGEKTIEAEDYVKA